MASPASAIAFDEIKLTQEQRLSLVRKLWMLHPARGETAALNFYQGIETNRHHQHQLCLSHLPVAPCGRLPDCLPANSKVVADRCDKLAARNLNSGFDSRRQVTVGSRNRFLKYRRDPLFEVVEGRIPVARFSHNNRQVGLQVIRFGTNL
jgi:hypothetical protein